MKRLGIALFAALALSTSAHAADLWNNAAPATSPVFAGTSASSWGGFYAGISGGYGWGTTSVNPAIAGGQVDNNSSGWTLGGQAGYNMDLGGFVIGGEADLQWANIGYSEPVPAVGTFKAGVDMFGTLRARVGIPVGQVMPYGTFGLAYGRGTGSVDNGVSTTTTSANHFGWTAGVGLEAQATPNLSLKAEYLYVDLRSQKYSGLGLAGGDRDINQRFSVIRAGLNYKF